MIKIGLLGTAHMHFASYAECVRNMPDAELNCVWDRNPDHAKEISGKYNIQFCQSRESLLGEEIDAVIICSENIYHCEDAVYAAQKKKHILCEKPIATSITDAEKMIEAADAHGVILQTAFPCRFITPVVQVKEQLDAGAFGPVRAINGTNRGTMPGGWFVQPGLSGGGAMLDHTVHVADLMRWILHSEPAEVYARSGKRFHDIPPDDCGTLMITFEGGVFATLDPSWSRPKSYPTWGDVTLKIVTDTATLGIDAFRQHYHLYSDLQSAHTYEYWGDNMDYKLIRSFIDAVKNGNPPVISGYDGLKALETALGAYRSVKTGKPVSLPLSKN